MTVQYSVYFVKQVGLHQPMRAGTLPSSARKRRSQQRPERVRPCVRFVSRYAADKPPAEWSGIGHSADRTFHQYNVSHEEKQANRESITFGGETNTRTKAQQRGRRGWNNDNEATLTQLLVRRGREYGLVLCQHAVTQLPCRSSSSPSSELGSTPLALSRL